MENVTQELIKGCHQDITQAIKSLKYLEEKLAGLDRWGENISKDEVTRHKQRVGDMQRKLKKIKKRLARE